MTRVRGEFEPGSIAWILSILIIDFISIDFIKNFRGLATSLIDPSFANSDEL